MKVSFLPPRQFTLSTVASIGILAGALLASTPSALRATGDFGEHLKEFEKHIPEYTEEVEKFASEIDAIVAAAREGEDVTEKAEGLIDLWEEVKIHGAIETKATSLYAGVWQGLGMLQKAASEGKSPEELDERGDQLKAALWQGLGGVRLAASLGDAIESSDSHDHDHDHGEKKFSSPSEAIHEIEHALDDAVSAYADGDVKKANEIIHDAYMGIFEGLEGDLIEKDPDLVTLLEQDFNADLPLLMKDGADVEKVRAHLEKMMSRLETAEKLLLEAAEEESEVF